MFKVKIITEGRIKEKWLEMALSEYEKRLLGIMEIEWVLVDSMKELEEKVFKEPSFIALDLKGKEISSEMFCQKLFLQWGKRISFVIGGAEGFSPKILSRASFRLCLSPMTFTHQIVRLLLLEQLYRAIQIEKGSSYHK